MAGEQQTDKIKLRARAPAAELAGSGLATLLIAAAAVACCSSGQRGAGQAVRERTDVAPVLVEKQVDTVYDRVHTHSKARSLARR